MVLCTGRLHTPRCNCARHGLRGSNGAPASSLGACCSRFQRLLGLTTLLFPPSLWRAAEQSASCTCSCQCHAVAPRPDLLHAGAIPPSSWRLVCGMILSNTEQARECGDMSSWQCGRFIQTSIKKRRGCCQLGVSLQLSGRVVSPRIHPMSDYEFPIRVRARASIFQVSSCLQLLSRSPLHG